MFLYKEVTSNDAISDVVGKRGRIQKFEIGKHFYPVLYDILYHVIDVTI